MSTQEKKVKDEARKEGKGKLLDAIKTQMSFRRKVLRKQVREPKEWSYSENECMHDVAELNAKLNVIISKVPPTQE
jgi:hypothetical protein